MAITNHISSNTPLMKGRTSANTKISYDILCSRTKYHMRSQKRQPGSYEPVKEKTGSYEPGSKKTGSYEPVKRTNGFHMNPLRVKRGSDEPRNIDNTWSLFTLLHPTSLRLIRRFGGQNAPECTHCKAGRLRTGVHGGGVPEDGGARRHPLQDTH